MEAHAPKCPTCGTGIQLHWDWCHQCGYDPDNLKPAGWISPADVAAAPAKSARREKRSAKKTEARTAKKSAKKSAKKEAKQPVAAGSVPIASLVDPFVTHDEQPAPRPAPPALPPLVIEPTPARPTAPVASEQVFHVSAAPIEVALIALLVLVGVAIGYLAVTSIIQVAEGASTTILDNVATVFFILLCSVITFAAFAQARALMKQRVILTPTDMTVHNRFGRVRRVSRDEIHQLRMSEREYPSPKGLNTALDVPYVQLTDGSGIWLDALGSRNPTAPPNPEQQGMYDQLAAALSSTGTRL